jgi:hypothetical protein
MMRVRLIASAFSFWRHCCIGDTSADASARHARVTVVDPSGAVIPAAQVTVIGIEPATSAGMPMPAQTSPQGVAEIVGLVPGRYAIQAEFQGFETRRVPDIRIRAGTNNQVMLLPIEGQKDSVVVSQDRQSAAADARLIVWHRRRANSLKRSRTTRHVGGAAVMAGPGAIIKVDSFEGALPPAVVRSIRFARSVCCGKP